MCCLHSSNAHCVLHLQRHKGSENERFYIEYNVLTDLPLVHYSYGLLKPVPQDFSMQSFPNFLLGIAQPVQPSTMCSMCSLAIAHHHGSSQWSLLIHRCGWFHCLYGSRLGMLVQCCIELVPCLVTSARFLVWSSSTLLCRLCTWLMFFACQYHHWSVAEMKHSATSLSPCCMRANFRKSRN